MKLTAVLLLLACAAATAQQTPLLQAETRMVLVDAVVTGKKGESVRDLTAKDFRLWEDGKEQSIRSFSVESDSTSSSTEPRRLILFFDNAGMSVTDQVTARQSATAFIDAVSGPGRMLAVVNYDGGYRVAQNFTDDAARLKRAVDAVRLNGPNTATIASRIGGGGPNDSPNSGALLRAVGSLAQNLNALPGRKIIVLLTGGNSLAGAQPADVEDLVRASNRSNVALYPVLQPVAQASSASGSDCGQRRGRGNFGGMDPTGCGTLDQSAPLTLASGTGGFVVPPVNDLAIELRKIGEEQTTYYVLGFSPADAKEGSCHSLRVKVDQSGTQVRARSNYCASKPQDLLAKSRVEQDLEQHAAAPQVGIAASIEAPFFYASPNVARVHVSLEMNASSLKVDTVKGKLHAELNLLGVATAPDGSTAARFSDIVKRDFENKQELDRWRSEPLHYEKEFKIVPGKYQLVVAFSSGGASFGKAEKALEIDALKPDSLAVSGLALSKDVKQAADLGLEASLIDEVAPLIASGRQFVPTGSPVFARAGELGCYFEVYGAQSENSFTAELRIVDAATGKQEFDSVAQPARGSGEWKTALGAVIPLARLSPGNYRLELVAKTAKQSAMRSADFTIK